MFLLAGVICLLGVTLRRLRDGSDLLATRISPAAPGAIVRFVSLVTSITLALYPLGFDDRIIGVMDYCVHPVDRVNSGAKDGGTKDPDTQKIRELRPDLVIANTDEQRAKTLEELKEGPWGFLVTETDSLPDVAQSWALLGKATVRAEEARQQRQDQEQSSARAKHSASTRDPVDVLVPVWHALWMATGGGTYLGDLLGACGLRIILADETGEVGPVRAHPGPAEAISQGPTEGPFKERRFFTLPRRPDAVLLPTKPYAFNEECRGRFEPVGVAKERVCVVDGSF